MAKFEKTKVTEDQLKDIIQDRLRFPLYMSVRRADRGLGFSVDVFATPGQALTLQQTVDGIVQELRASYQLIDS